MAEEAFALSPISARPAMPNDADYDAIREAFMETSRGRWFLSEYAKRNRNADTRMVLDAVARIEENLAAQKQTAGPSLSESLVAIRASVGEARAGVAKVIAGLENASVLAAAHDGARIIREVSWTLRECGADVRICNLLDTQVAAVVAGHRLVAEIDGDAVLAAFDRLLDRIHDLAGEPHVEVREPRSEVEDEPASPSADGDLPEAAAAIQTAAEFAPIAAEPVAAEPDTAGPDTAAEAGLKIVAAAETEEIEFVEPQPVLAEEAADVDAMLDLVAMEMSAPQPPEPGELEAAIAAAKAERADAGPEADQRSEIERLVAEVAIQREPEAAELSAEPAPSIDISAMDLTMLEIGERGEVLGQPASGPVMNAPATTPAMMSATGETVTAPSLGAALLASGVVSDPTQPRSDALAPLRRMSQAEKVAFFS